MNNTDFAQPSQFVAGAQKRFDLPLLAGCFADARPPPDIPAPAVGLSLETRSIKTQDRCPAKKPIACSNLKSRLPCETDAFRQCGLTWGGWRTSLGYMECLHAPWRIQYILAPKPAAASASLFTTIAQSNDDEAHHVVARHRTCFALLNTYPYNGGHLLIVPYKQTSSFDDLTDNELLDLMRLMRRCQHALTQIMQPDGFNIGVNLGKVAGAGVVDHLHIHVVPRWNGDTNFMPVLASTTVLPQALTELARQLRAILTPYSAS